MLSTSGTYNIYTGAWYENTLVCKFEHILLVDVIDCVVSPAPMMGLSTPQCHGHSCFMPTYLAPVSRTCSDAINWFRWFFVRIPTRGMESTS